MYQDKVTLCGSNAYEKKYYLNPDFSGLPEQIKQELQIACVLFLSLIHIQMCIRDRLDRADDICVIAVGI